MSATEPLSRVLRRLHEEAFTVCPCGLPTCKRCRGESTAKLTLRYALPALADLVEAVEKREEFCDCSFGGCDWTDAENAALAALRERLEAKP